ncbi:MAG: formate dehydrogenase accessory protein FdhE [Candidatus Zixiibacteriota bacterium]|nr:MAG: formate dehydrogenase accessory protein FdhE [candidate division Zixibacteria bacterium]
MSAPAESKVYLGLCQQIAEAKTAFKTRHRDQIDIPEDETRKRAGEGNPLLDLRRLKTESKLLREFFDDLISVLKANEFFSREEVSKLIAGKEKIDPVELIKPVIDGDLTGFKAYSDRLGVETDLVSFVGLNLSQAVAELYAEKVKNKVDQESWVKGNCPVCGSHPAIERLMRDDGKRMLRCSLCGTEWYFKRIMCPFCSNEDHNSLRFFVVEEEPPTEKSAFRVDVCDKCKIYIKTLDERKLPESAKPDLYLENLSTIYLDVLAQKDGFESPTYWMVAPSESLFV